MTQIAPGTGSSPTTAAAQPKSTSAPVHDAPPLEPSKGKGSGNGETSFLKQAANRIEDNPLVSAARDAGRWMLGGGDSGANEGSASKEKVTPKEKSSKQDKPDATEKPTAPDKPDASEKPDAGDAPVHDAPPGDSTSDKPPRVSDDGLSDRKLREESNVGGRDAKIGELKGDVRRSQVKDGVLGGIGAAVGAVADKVKPAAEVYGGVGAAMGVAADGLKPATEALGAVGLEGAEKRAKDGLDTARAGAEGLQKIEEGAKQGLDSARSGAEDALGKGKVEDTLTSQQSDLERQRALNYLADAAHATGMTESAVNVLEGDAKIGLDVADKTSLGADAEYSRPNDQITVDSRLVENAGKEMAKLQGQGIVDGDGRILDAAAFDRSQVGETSIEKASLIGVHEMTHAAQDKAGTHEVAEQRATDINAQTQEQLKGASPEERPAIEAAGAREVELAQIDAMEYDAYHAQEMNDLKSGAFKDTRVTIDEDGAPLPRREAAENILALQTGAPLPHGPSAGTAPGGTTPATGAASDDAIAGKRWPGDELAGKRWPGEELAGKRWPGEELAGKRWPGEELAGKRWPGEELAGKRWPGEELS